MRFITEFKASGAELKYGSNPVIGHRKCCAEGALGESISQAFPFKELGTIEESGLAGLYSILEIEAFPMDKWVEFKQNVFEHFCVYPGSTKKMLDFIQELESFGKPSGDAITNLSGQMEYRGPSSHCKACEDEKNGVKHIMAQKHTCRK